MRHLWPVALLLVFGPGAVAQQGEGPAGPPPPAEPSAEEPGADAPKAKAPSRPAPPLMRGMALTLQSKDPDYDYGPALSELPALGVTHVSVFVHLYQRTGRSPFPARHPLKTQQDAVVLRVLRQVRELGLEPALVPLVLLENPADDEWRGNLEPPDRQGRTKGQAGYAGPDWGTWFSAYQREALHFARLAQEGGATLFVVGSELASTEEETAAWRELIGRVRRVFGGRLTYGANWDHYEEPGFWPLLDAIGLSAYYELTQSLTPTQDELNASWVGVRERLLSWRARAGLASKSLIFLEVGYPSLDGGARHPWDYTAKAKTDVEEQAMAYRAFVNAWTGRSELLGVFFYEWWGEGGLDDGKYTPRGKPALRIVREYFQAP